MGASIFFTAAMILALGQRGQVAMVGRTSASHHCHLTVLKRVWQELEYRIDVCRVTRGAHIEHLWLKKTFSVFLRLWTFPVR
jgi:hypothetical protein